MGAAGICHHDMLRWPYDDAPPKTKVRIGHPSGAARRADSVVSFFLRDSYKWYSKVEAWRPLRQQVESWKIMKDRTSTTWLWFVIQASLIVNLCPFKVMDVDAAVRLEPPELLRAAMVRTARCLMDGQVSTGWWLGFKVFQWHLGVGVVEFVACWSGRHIFPGQYGRLSLPSDEHFNFSCSIAGA